MKSFINRIINRIIRGLGFGKYNKFDCTREVRKNKSLQRVLSVRVSLEVYDALNNMAAFREISLSDCLREAVEAMGKPPEKKPRKNDRNRYYWSLDAISDGIVKKGNFKKTPSKYMRKKYSKYIKTKS